MKRTSKITAIFLALALIIPGAYVYAADPGETPVLVYELTDTDKYADDHVVITIREEYSGWNKLFEAKDFPEISVTKIEYVTPLFTDEKEVPMLDTSHYKQVLTLYFDPSENTIPDVMKKLSENKMILEIFPDLLTGTGEDIIVPIDPCLPGDANGDGTFNLKDVALLMKYLAGWKTNIDDCGLHICDMMKDGYTNSRDVAYMLKVLAGFSVLSIPEQTRLCELYFERYWKDEKMPGMPTSADDVWVYRYLGTFGDDCKVAFMGETGVGYCEIVIQKQIGNTVVTFCDSQMCYAFTKDAVYSLEEAYEKGLLTDADLEAINAAIGVKL